MKKLLLVAILLMGFAVTAIAAETSSTIPLQLVIPAQFGFTLTDYSWDFGTIAPPGGAQTGIGIFCRSNHGVPWKLKGGADPFENASGDIIPSTDPGFVMAAWGAGEFIVDPITELPTTEPDPGWAQGTFPYSGPVPDTTLLFDFYESTIGEGNDPFTALTLGLYVWVTDGQASGLYTTDFIITMYE